MFLATGGVKTHQQKLDHNEEINVKLYSLDEVKNLMKQNKIIQAMHVTCILYGLQKLEGPEIINESLAITIVIIELVVSSRHPLLPPPPPRYPPTTATTAVTTTSATSGLAIFRCFYYGEVFCQVKYCKPFDRIPFASASTGISTKPNPRLLPVSLSIATLAELTFTEFFKYFFQFGIIQIIRQTSNKIFMATFFVKVLNLYCYALMIFTYQPLLVQMLKSKYRPVS
jgi:hypothetical protein